MLSLIREHRAQQALERYTETVAALSDTLGAAFSKKKQSKSEFVKAIENEIDEIHQGSNVVRFEEIAEIKREAKTLYPHLFDKIIATKEA